ncbi:hypothetical protein LWI29_034696 [Acer saccharum]|uniref:Uncharacterized protein n=1 Tax=Acer saccharum TaxID=4024 RepID=A0AA39VZ56_ACESA|nr:hypothetical protein LWI29_034696 [Acer saccharum]
MHVASYPPPPDYTWYLDIGATHHMTSTAPSDSIPFNTSVLLGNGATLPITNTELHHLGSMVPVEPLALPCTDQAPPCATAAPPVPAPAAAPHVLAPAVAAPPLSAPPTSVPTHHMTTRLCDGVRQPKIHTDGTVHYPLS